MHVLLLFLAKYLIGIVCATLFLYWLTMPRKDKVRIVVFGTITAVVAFALAKTGSAILYNPRPFVEQSLTPLYPHGPDNGFPSDHMLLASVVAVTAYAASKRLGWILLVAAILIGVSRVLGYIHSPIDIIGSLVFSIIGGVAAYYATPRIMAAFKKRGV